MSRYVISRTHLDFFESGEVQKETKMTLFTTPIEGCPFSHLNGRFPKDTIVFETDDKAKIIRIMVIYRLMKDQRDASVKAANEAFRHNLDIITGHAKDKKHDDKS